MKQNQIAESLKLERRKFLELAGKTLALAPYIITSRSQANDSGSALPQVDSQKENKLESELRRIEEEYQIPEDEIERFRKILQGVRYSKTPKGVYVNNIPRRIKVLERVGRLITRVQGEASIYASSEGNKTATGGPVLDDELTAALNTRIPGTRPLLMYAENPESGKSSYFIVTDNGPYHRQGYPHTSRILDATPRLADALGFYEGSDKRGKPKGLAKVIQLVYKESLAHLIKKA